jgi:cytosine/adenosine deaminase-related metal-dependent hydrolase
MQNAVLFRAALLRSFDPARPRTEPADVLVRGRLIEAVAPAGSLNVPGASVIDARGHLLMPGLVNGHFHSPVNHLKGTLDGLPLELFMLRESPNLDALRPSPDFAYVRSLLGAAEMLRRGVTAVQDDAFLVPAPTTEIVDAIMRAYEASGIRARVALDQSDLPEIGKLPFLGEIVPDALRPALEAAPEATADALLAQYDHLIGHWHGAAGGRLQAAISCSAPQRVSDRYLRALEALSSAHDLPFFVHVLETRTQRVLGQLRGRSLLVELADRGALSARSNVIHAIWMDDDDLDLIAGSGAVVAHNPICNLRLGSGIMPFRKLRDRGIPICLGSDEAIADDAVNLWQVGKMAGLIHNITDPDYARWPRAGEVLDCLVKGGATAMRAQHRIGMVRAGMEADLILLDLDTLAFTPLNDIDRQLVYCEDGSSVRLVMVAGEIVVRDGLCTRFDERALRAEARAMTIALDGAGRTQASAAPWMPHYRTMHMRAAATPVGMIRSVPHDNGAT